MIDFTDMKLTLHKGDKKVSSGPFDRETVVESVNASESDITDNKEVTMWNELLLDNVNPNKLIKLQIKNKVIIQPGETIECEVFTTGDLTLDRVEITPNVKYLAKNSLDIGTSVCTNSDNKTYIGE